MSIGKKKIKELLRLNPKRPWKSYGFGKMTPSQRADAQRKGGLSVSKSQDYMKEIGRVGGKHGGGPR